LRLAIIHHNLSVRGGAERLVCEVGDRLEKRGHEVIFVTSHFTPEHAYPKLRNKEVIKIGFPLKPPGGYMHAYFEAFNTFRSLLKAFRSIDVDVFLFSKQYSLLHFAKKLQDIPSAMYVHWPETLLAQFTTPLRRIYRKPIELMEAVSFSEADAVLCNSAFTAKTIHALFNRKATVAYPGVDTDFFKPPSQKDIDERLILSINRFAEGKNMELAINAMRFVLKKIPDAHLILAGNLEENAYSYYARLERLIKDRRLNHAVEMVTNLSDIEVLRLYQKCTVFLYTPLREHFGIGPIEAMACGKPVIVSDHGGPKESVIHGVTGFRLPNDPEAWGGHIVRLLKDPDLRVKMGEVAREHVERNFTWENMVNRIEDILKKIGER